MKKLLVGSAILALMLGCNNNSETKKTDDTTAIQDNVNTKLDTVTTTPADTLMGSTEVSDADRSFVTHVAMANSAEVELGKLAADKGGSQGVKDFGNMMVTDHGGAQSQLKAIAGSLSLNAPDSIDAKHLALKKKLSGLSGAAFDKEYVSAMINGHREVIAMFEKQASEGKNGQVKQFANNTLPTLRTHLQHAEALK